MSTNANIFNSMSYTFFMLQQLQEVLLSSSVQTNLAADEVPLGWCLRWTMDSVLAERRGASSTILYQRLRTVTITIDMGGATTIDIIITTIIHPHV